ncbi:hypothetical protein QAD02_020680 [Eretmocerus hayati]|uniref:Uncharacterized protein n=1 Tax=Eretmocerus hayati TaxID=131215 RepID=A0ACC2PNC1_9HYME|nr:hypothetical protein QAD02_020680 [Eretmocerus hayati]
MHLGLCLMMHKNYASRNLIDALPYIGFCTTYEKTLSFEAAICKNPAIYRFLDAYVQLIFDNADHNTNTYDGRRTFHYMGGLVSITPGSSVQTSDHFDRLKQKMPAPVIAATNTIPLVQYTKPNTPDSGLVLRNYPPLPPLKVQSRDFLWFYRKKADSTVPSWNGQMEECTQMKEFFVSRVVPLPFIHHAPTNPSTIFPALLEVERKRIYLKQDKIFVTMDQPLHWKSCKLIEHLVGTKYDMKGKVVPRIGLFHGNQALSGKAYARAINGHRIIQNTLAQLILDFIGFDSDEQQFLNKLIGEIGNDIVRELVEGEQMSKITDKFNDELMSLRDNGPTAQLWVQYFFMIELLEQFIQSERVGGWLNQLWKRKVLPLSAVTSSVKIDDQIQPIDPLLIFQRTTLNMRQSNDMREYLKIKMATFPVSLFDGNGMLKMKKSALDENINQIPGIPFTGDKCFVVDGGMLIHKVIFQANDKLDDILQKFVRYFRDHFTGDITTVPDGYPDETGVYFTKFAERLRRQKMLSSAERIISRETTIVPQRFFANDKNKRRFIEMLDEELTCAGSIVKIGDEDADTLIVETALTLSNADDNVVIVGEDIDLLVYSINAQPMTKFAFSNLASSKYRINSLHREVSDTSHCNSMLHSYMLSRVQIQHLAFRMRGRKK